MKPLAHLTVEAVEAIHAEVLTAHGGAAGLRDRALLESVVAAPQATMMGRPLLEDPFEAAAAYLLYLCQNHPFVDGNQRTALAACLGFLSENGLFAEEKLDVDSWGALTLAVASGEWERTDISQRVRELLVAG